jgi:hypothetical protein
MHERASSLGWEWNETADNPSIEADLANNRLAAWANGGQLSARDLERAGRYAEGAAARKVDARRRYATNQKVIARAKVKRAAQGKK